MSRRVICAGTELAGVVQSEIDKQGLGGELEVQCHPRVPAGMILVEGEVHSWYLIERYCAGLRVLL